MADMKSTEEAPVSKPRVELVKESDRIGELLQFTAKQHFESASFWEMFHFVVGLGSVVASAIAGCSAFAAFDKHKLVTGILLVIVSVLSAVLTFLNPHQKSSAHLLAGNNSDALLGEIRRFRTISCIQEQSDAVLTKRLTVLCERRDHINKAAPQPLPWMYNRVKKGLEQGQAQFAVDRDESR